MLKGDTEKGLKWITQAVDEGSMSIETKNNHGVALALNNDLDGAISDWQDCMSKSDKHFQSKFNYALAQLNKRNYEIVIQTLSELEDVKSSEIVSKTPFYLGLVLMRKGSIAEAHVKFEEAALIDPSNGDIQNNIGICSYLLGDEDDSIQKFHHAQRVEQGHLLSSCNLGRIYLNEGLLDKAIASTEYALWLDTNNVCARTTHALTIYALGDLETALNELKHLSKVIKTDYELQYQLGRLYIDKNDAEKGIEHLKTALQLEPEAIEVMSHLGVISQLKKRYDESRRMYIGVLEKEPNNVRTLINLALNYMDNKNLTQALELLNKAQKLSPDLPEVYFNIGCALIMEDSIFEAVENYKKAIEIDKKYLPAKFNLSLCYLSAESITNAAVELEEILEINPNFGLAHFMLGCAAQQKQNLNSALKHWEAALKYDVKNPDLYTNLGISYYIKDKTDLAVSNFQNVLRLRDGSAQDFNNLALAQIKNKNIPEAIEAFEKSLSMEPYNPVTHSNLGLAYYFNKDIEKATEEWATVGRLDPEYAIKRRNIETATYDDTQAAFPLINYQAYSLKLAPEYSDSPLKLVPAESMVPWVIDTHDKDLAMVPELKQKINKIKRATRVYKM